MRSNTIWLLISLVWDYTSRGAVNEMVISGGQGGDNDHNHNPPGSDVESQQSRDQSDKPGNVTDSAMRKPSSENSGDPSQAVHTALQAFDSHRVVIRNEFQQGMRSIQQIYDDLMEGLAADLKKAFSGRGEGNDAGRKVLSPTDQGGAGGGAPTRVSDAITSGDVQGIEAGSKCDPEVAHARKEVAMDQEDARGGTSQVSGVITSGELQDTGAESTDEPGADHAGKEVTTDQEDAGGGVSPVSEAINPCEVQDTEARSTGEPGMDHARGKEATDQEGAGGGGLRLPLHVRYGTLRLTPQMNF